jgi:serine/threonine-protein kinase
LEEEAWIGRKVGDKYRIIQSIGRGGMGVVFEAENLAVGKRVALKFIDSESAQSAEGLQRFQREARAAGTIESAHIVQVFDVGEEQGRPFLVMELLRGENLGTRLHRQGCLSVAETVHVMEQVLRGLHRAHGKGIIHRDLKPENVFLEKTDADPMFAKIVDFGISKFVGPDKPFGQNTITQRKVVLGTPYYMAPEQARSVPDLDERADLWSLGVIGYECLSGIKPFAGDTYEQVIIAICTQPPVDLHTVSPEIPPSLADVIMQALTLDRDHRYGSAEEFMQALQRAVPDLLGRVLPLSDVPAQQPSSAPQAQEVGHRTDVSWSSSDGIAPVKKKHGHLSRNTRLGLLGVVMTLLAFSTTVGVISYLQEQKEGFDQESTLPMAMKSENLPVEEELAAVKPAVPQKIGMRIETNEPHAQVHVDGSLLEDGLLFGEEGEACEVQVSAPGFRTQQRQVIIRPDAGTIRFDLVKVLSEVGRPEMNSRPSAPSSTSVAGGLELKTDIP